MVCKKLEKNSIYSDLRRILRGNVTKHRSLSRYISYKAGGPADFFAVPRDNDDLCNLIRYITNNGIPYFVLGKGTNILVHDDGFRGIVIFLGRNINNFNINGDEACAEAGFLLWDLLDQLANRGLGGLEKLVGIPGSIGGALYMNAGALDCEIFNCLISISFIDEFGNSGQICKENIAYGYRKGFTDENKIIIGAKFRLQEDNPEKLLKTMEDIWTKRKKKQPLSYPNAGSVFKRPPNHYAGDLIEKAGLKGYRIGGAVVSTKHANFILNKYHATAQDIYNLIMKVQETVYNKFNVLLEIENKIIGWN